MCAGGSASSDYWPVLKTATEMPAINSPMLLIGIDDWKK